MAKHTQKQNQGEYAKETEHDESVLNPEIKADHDLSRKERREIEKAKLKAMSTGGKLQYLWAYYKWCLIGFIAVCLVIYGGVDLYQRSLMKTVLTVSIVNCVDLNSEQLGDSIEEILGCAEDKYKSVDIYTTLTTEADAASLDTYSQMTFTTEVAAGALDVLVMPETLFESLSADNLSFWDMKELLGSEEYSKFGTQANSTCLTFSGEDLSDVLGVSYEPVCIAVLKNSENAEAAAAWIESLS